MAAPRPFSGGDWLDPPLELNVVLHGNSLFTNVAERVATELPAATVNERVVGGAKTADLTAEFATQIHAAFFDAGKRNVVVMIEWVDDINDFGADGQDAYDHGASYVAAAQALEWEVALCSCIDTTEFDPPDARAGYRDDLNDLLRVDWAGADIAVDLEADTMFDAATNSAANTTNYNEDGIHLKSPGQDRMAELIASAVSA